MIRTLFLLLISYSVVAQQKVYTTANAHSHNDYEQDIPFRKAYKQQFGSIEADIFLQDDTSLFVAHQSKDLELKRRTFDSLYLIPLVQCIRNNKGSVFADRSRKLQLMIDIKTDALPTLEKIIEAIRKHPELINTPSLKFVISGSRPDPSIFASYPAFIWFDGNLGTNYSTKALSRIAMMSANFKQYTAWNGQDSIPASDFIKLVSAIKTAHALNKPVRFWGTPDNERTWREMMRLEADYINTDRIGELTAFLKNVRSKVEKR